MYISFVQFYYTMMGVSLNATTSWLGTVALTRPVAFPRQLCSHKSRTVHTAPGRRPTSTNCASIAAGSGPRFHSTTTTAPFSSGPAHTCCAGHGAVAGRTGGGCGIRTGRCRLGAEAMHKGMLTSEALFGPQPEGRNARFSVQSRLVNERK